MTSTSVSVSARVALSVCIVCAPLLLTVAAHAEAPFSFDAAPGRLPKDVVPVDYDIAVVPDLQQRTFTGKESVTLRFRSPSAKIVFNTLDLTLQDVKLDGSAVQHVMNDNDAQLSTVTLAAPAAAGMHTLSFSYRGKIQTRPQGMFAQPYGKPGGGTATLLSTQFEATDARRMFACWDEPAFRATFQLTITVPKAWATISNMPVAKRIEHGALATTTFERTPSMPSYLVNLDAGDLSAVHADNGGVKFSVWAVRGREQEGSAALANAQQILADYNDYFGYAFPLPKLDSIAIPGGFSGAMENWGAITYMDSLLLLSKNSALEDRQMVYSTQAHEMAHQWNGDLVTMGWWDDLWLNESFASWRAAKETDLRNPTWNWWQVQDADKESAMFADSQGKSHPIQVHVTDEQQASSAFDPSITYSKGQAVLRMFESYLGADTFRDGIRRYIKAHAFGNATTADLWNALSGVSGKDIGAIAASWTEQPGFPVVSVKSSCDSAGHRTLALSQRRFELRPIEESKAGAPHWSVPLQVRSGIEGAIQPVLLDKDGQSVAAGMCQEPLSVDAGAVGFYRAEYDAPTLSANTHEFARLPDGDRIALLDDQWALVEAGAAPLPSYLALAANMGQDLNARAWQQIADALGVIEYDERGSQGHEAFAAYARSILKPAAEQLGWDRKADETPATQQLRRTLITDLGVWGDSAVIAEARRRFALFMHNHSTMAPDDQAPWLTIVGLYADAMTFEQLHELAKATKDDAERGRFFLALAGVRDERLAQQIPQIAMSNEIPPQSIDLRTQMIVALRGEHPQLAWNAFADKQQVLLAPEGNLAPLILAQYAPQFFWNSLPLDQLETWLKVHLPAGMEANMAKGLQGARFKITEKQALVPAADSYVAAHAAHA